MNTSCTQCGNDIPERAGQCQYCNQQKKVITVQVDASEFDNEGFIEQPHIKELIEKADSNGEELLFIKN